MTQDAEPKSLKRNRRDEVSSSRPRKLPRVENTPPEIVEQIAKHLVSDHPDYPRDAQQSLANFTLANKYIRNVVAGEPKAKGVDASSEVEWEGGSPALKQFGARIKRLGSLAVQTFKDTFTEDGLPDEASYGVPREQRRDIPVAAHDVIDAVGPIVAYQREDKAKLGESIIGLANEDAWGESTHSLARYSHGLDEQQRSDLGHDAIELLRGESPLVYHARIKAAEALAQLEKHGHLTVDHRTYIDATVTDRPALGALLDDKRQALAEQDGHASTVASNVSNRRADDRDRSLDERIGDLEKQRKTASEAGVYSEHGRLDVRASIAKEIPKLYNRARAELAASVRPVRSR